MRERKRKIRFLGLASVSLSYSPPRDIESGIVMEPVELAFKSVEMSSAPRLLLPDSSGPKIPWLSSRILGQLRQHTHT